MKNKILIAVFLIIGQLHAEDTDSAIKEVEEYLNRLTTFESDFVQIDKSGHSSVGHFFLKRPYLMKMDYRKPSTHVIIAQNNHITHYDRELKEKTVTSMYSSPLSFFLERKIKLRDNLKVLAVRSDDEALSVKFCKKDEETEGAVLLVFSKNPLTLRKWIVFDNKKDESPERSTDISLLNWKLGYNIPDKEFEKFN